MSTRSITEGRASADDDRGAVLVLSALAMIVIVIIAAIVVDLGHERSLRRSAQSVSDLSALAGSQALMQPAGAAPVDACEEAMQYVRLNIENLPGGVTVPCSDLANGLLLNPDGAVICEADTARRTVTDGGTAAPYQIEISWPIPDADIADSLIADPQGLREFDGHDAQDQCDRFAVDIQIDQSRFFSQVLRDGDLSGSAEAVARRLPYEDTRAPNLWLLEPYECDVLKVAGGSMLEVGVVEAAGLITADSDGSDCRNNSSYVIGTEGAGAEIDAFPNSESGNPNGLDPAGEISLFAMDDGQQHCTSNPALGNVNACKPGDVASGAINPEPVQRATRATRSPVDFRFNCKSNYPDYHGLSLNDCPYTDDDSPYTDLLSTWVTTNTTSGTPAGWTVYGDDPPSEPCTIKNGDAIAVPGNVIVKCGTLRVNGGFLAFTGGNVVFENKVVMTGGAIYINQFAGPIGTAGTAPPALPSPLCDRGPSFSSACFTNASADAVWVYQRDGGWDMRGGSMVINNGSFVQAGVGVGSFNIFNASSAGVSVAWHAPTEGPLKGLALWSESASTKYAISGNGNIDLEGVFFTPEAYPFTISGGSALTPQAAQFVSRSLKITGGGALRLSPLGAELVELPPPASVLIR